MGANVARHPILDAPGEYESACNRQRAKRSGRAHERAKYEYRIVRAEFDARSYLAMADSLERSGEPDSYGMHLVHAERYRGLAKDAKREAIRLQRQGGSARLP